MLRAVDISGWQSGVDWSAVDVDLVIVKLSEATAFADRRADEHVKGARSVGKPVHGYHFARLNAPASANAAIFIDRWRAVGGLEFAWLDFEDDHNPLGPDDSARWALDWLAAVEQVGIPVGFYTFSGYANRFTPDPALARYPLWLANYGPNDGSDPPQRSAPKPPAPWTSWTGWQHTSTASIPGFSGRVDLNVFDPAVLRPPTPSTRGDIEMLDNQDPVVQSIMANFEMLRGLIPDAALGGKQVAPYQIYEAVVAGRLGVDVKQLAAELAPLIKSSAAALSDADLQAIAVHVADEQARRQQA